MLVTISISHTRNTRNNILNKKICSIFNYLSLKDIYLQDKGSKLRKVRLRVHT